MNEKMELMIAPKPENETQRLHALERLGLLDTEAEPEFDELVNLAAAICGTPISLVTLVDEGRQWFKAAIGLEAKETPREVAFCAHSILQRNLFVVEDAAVDERFFDNPLVTGEPHIRFYAGMPVSSPDGYPMGTLCVIDREPRHLTGLQKNMLTMLAKQVNARLELRQQRKELQIALREAENSRNELRASEERFRIFMDNSPFLSFMKDMEGRLVFYSQRFADRFNISRTSWLGKSDFDLWPEEEATAIRQNDIEVLMAGMLQVLEEQVSEGSGIVSHWRAYKFPCVSSRGETLLAGVGVDISEMVAKETALHKTQAELQAANVLLQELVVTDSLTGLGNRRVFEERLTAEVTAVRRGQKLALLMLDIDHFKSRNDTFGHQDGDDVLRQIGALLKRLVRGNEIAARYGGEEFVILMPNATEHDGAGLAARLLKAIRAEVWVHRPVTVSIGVADCDRVDMTGSELVDAADTALYAAKAKGRDCFVRRSEAS
jgi:diguanylate cyclase (GGDEF)-like protein/PAS domain S-box-containing protein